MAGTNSLSLAAGSVSAGSSCTFSVDITHATVGSATLTSGALTSSLGDSGTAGDVLTVTAAGVPVFTKAFAPASIVQGDTSVLTFTIDNSSALIAATSVDFTDSLPAGMTVAATPNATTTCTGGTLTAAAGAGSIGYTGGEVAASGTCAVSVDVTSATVGGAVNTTGDLTSSLGNSGTASDTLTVTAAPLPGFTKVFGTASIVQGDTSVLTFTIDNTGALIAATSLDFSDSLPAGVTVDTTPNAATTCTGGTLTAAAGSGTITYTGGSVAAGASCTVSATVYSATVGAHLNTSGSLTSSLGDSGTASDTLTVTAAPLPVFAKSFDPASIVQGATSVLSFGIDNGSALVAATDMAFTDVLPAGVTVAAVPGLTSTCGGTLSAAALGDTITLSGGTVAAGASCAISVAVTSATVGDHTNTTGALTSSLGDSGTASAVLSVTAAPVLGFSQSFAPAEILERRTSTIRFALDNSASLIGADTLAFHNSLPAGLTVASPLTVGTTCVGGTFSIDAGNGGFGFSATSLAAGATCEASIVVTAAAPGDLVNTTGALTSSLGSSGSSSATLRVTDDPNGTVTFVQETNVDGTFSFASAEAALNFDIATSSGTGSHGPVSVLAGVYTITQSRPEGQGTLRFRATTATAPAIRLRAS